MQNTRLSQIRRQYRILFQNKTGLRTYSINFYNEIGVPNGGVHVLEVDCFHDRDFSEIQEFATEAGLEIVRRNTKASLTFTPTTNN